MPEARAWPVRWPGAFLAVAFLLTAGSVWAATWIEPEVDFVDTVPDHPGLEPYRRMLAELDGVRFVAVYMAAEDASLREDAFDALVTEQESLTNHMETAMPGAFSHTLSVYEAMRTGNYMLAKIATAGNPPESSYALPSDPVTWEAVKSQALDGDTLDDVLARDGSSAIMLFFLSTRDASEARALTGDAAEALAAWAASNDHPVTKDHQPSGLLWASHVTDERNREETLRWMPWVAGAVGLTLLWVVRRPSNAVIAVVSLGCALAWTFGLMGLAGVRISFLTFILAPVVMGIGIDHAVHLLHRYEQERPNADRRAAMDTAVRTTWGAIVTAGLTTAAGVAVLGFVPAPLFAQIGLVASVGVMLGMISALTVAPALRSVWPDKAGGTRRDRVGPVLAKLGRPGRTLPAIAVLVLLAGTAVAAVVADSQTRIESGSAENEFPQDDPTILLQQRIEAEYGAFQRAYLIVEGDMTDPAALLGIHEAAAETADIPLWRGASTVADLLLADEATDEGALDIAMAALLGGAGQTPSDAERLPQTADEARDALDALHADPLWGGIVPFTITPDYTLAVVAIELDPWEDQTALIDVRDALLIHEAALQERLGPDFEVHAAGAPVNRAAVIEQTPDDVRLATLGSAAAVGAVLLVAWARRGWRGLALASTGAALVLVAALWLLATIPALDGFYQWAATRGAAANSAALNDMFLLAFAITVAVGVDDLVHIANRYWEARDEGHARPAQAALKRAGRAITGTTATTFVAFAAMTGIYFLQSKNLAILTSAGVAYALLLTLLVSTFAFRKTLGPDAHSAPDGRA